MKFICKLIVCLNILSILVGFQAFATDISNIIIDNINVDTDKNEIQIIGSRSDGKTGEILTIQVINPGKNSIDIDSLADSELGNVLNNIGEAVTDSKGNFTYLYHINENGASSSDTEKYVVRITGQNCGFTERQFDYVSTANKIVALAHLNHDTAAADMRAEIEKYKGWFGLDLPLYYNFSDDLKEVVASDIYKNRVYASVTDLKKYFNDRVVLTALKNASDTDGLRLIVNTYNDIIGVTLTSPTFSGTTIFNDDYRTNVFGALHSKSGICNEITDVNLLFREIVLLKATNIAGNKDLVTGVLSEFNDLISKDDSSISAIMNNYFQATNAKIAYVNGEILASKPQTIVALKATIKSAMETFGVTTDIPTSVKGTGGTSTHISVSVPIPAPTPTAIPIVEQFIDLDDVAWAKESVNELTKLGVVNGFGAKEFKPNDKVTREQFVKMVMIAFGLVDETATSNYSDVPSDSWAYKSVSSAKKLGIVNGIDDNKFGFNNPITRQDMSVIIYRIATMKSKELMNKNEKKVFSDNEQIADYAKEAIEKMQQSGMIDGLENGEFRPNDFATRAQAAKMIFTLLKSE